MAKTATIKRREGAPEFLFGGFGFPIETLKEFVNSKGYVNFDILSGKEGGYYAKISDYGVSDGGNNEELPF